MWHLLKNYGPGVVFWDSNNKVYILEGATRGTYFICISITDDLLISILNDKNVYLLVKTRYENMHDEYCI